MARSRTPGAQQPHPGSSPRLDPLLVLGAKRASREPLSELRRFARGAALVPRSVRDLPAGMQSLSAQLSPTAARGLARDDQVPVLIDTPDPDAVAQQIQSWSGTCRRLTPHVLSARVPRGRLSDLAATAAVRYVEASTRLELKSDLAHGSAALVRGGLRTVPQTGQGVLVGVVDSGIDTAHPAFRAGSNTRIVDYLDQTNGRRYGAAEIDAGDAADSPDSDGHGTHVAGIAAGNGAGSPGNQFAGVAPEADLAIVKTTLDTADIAAGVAHIFEVADQRSQPCVVNLSLGGHFGGHDGSSVIERVIDELSGPGRLVAVAAGNEGATALHASTTLELGRTTPARWVADFEILPRLIELGGAPQLLGLLVVQVWHQHEDQLTVRLRAPTGDLIEAPPNGEIEVDRTVFLVEASHQHAVYSGDNLTTFLVLTLPQQDLLSGWSVIAEEQSAGDAPVGAVHAWILQRPMGRFTAGAVRSHLVGMPGTAFSAITVASYATRKSWDSRDTGGIPSDFTAINLEDISFFSSPGPTRDGHNKPEIAAPGHFVIAPLSQAADEGSLPSFLRIQGMEYVALRGTSMATPYVTGALALLLEANPTMDWAEVKRRLIKSTRTDAFTTPCWNPRWGYGKLDVEKLLGVDPLA